MLGFGESTYCNHNPERADDHRRDDTNTAASDPSL
jgi:hypothetical protein